MICVILHKWSWSLTHKVKTQLNATSQNISQSTPVFNPNIKYDAHTHLNKSLSKSVS